MHLPIQFSCISSSAELADRQRFRYYFQMLAMEGEIAGGFFAVIKHFRWRKVAFIEQEENLFTVVSSCGGGIKCHFLGKNSSNWQWNTPHSVDRAAFWLDNSSYAFKRSVGKQW